MKVVLSEGYCGLRLLRGEDFFFQSLTAGDATAESAWRYRLAESAWRCCLTGHVTYNKGQGHQESQWLSVLRDRVCILAGIGESLQELRCK
jgi:hypothetical protein